jgi:hypothetical protein
MPECRQGARAVPGQDQRHRGRCGGVGEGGRFAERLRKETGGETSLTRQVEPCGRTGGIPSSDNALSLSDRLNAKDESKPCL